MGKEAEEEGEVGGRGSSSNARRAKVEADDEEVVGREMEGGGEGGGCGERPRDALGAEVDPDGVDEGEGEEVREGEKEEGLGEGGDVGVLAEEEEDSGHVKPEQSDRQGGTEEEEYGAVKG